MNKGLYLARKRYLESIISKVSCLNGGDDEESLRMHLVEVLDTYPEEQIEKAITCYEEILKKLQYNAERARYEKDS